LPGFHTASEGEQQKATGTNGKATEFAPILLTNQLPKNSDFSDHFLAITGTLDRSNPDISKTEKNRFS
jgi:hypothetical protein